MIKVIIESDTNFMELEETINECLEDITNLIDIKYSTTKYEQEGMIDSDVIYSAMIIYKEEK